MISLSRLELIEKRWEIREKKMLEEDRRFQTNWKNIKLAKLLRKSGLSYKEISIRIGIHKDTVRRYVKRI